MSFLDWPSKLKGKNNQPISAEETEKCMKFLQNLDRKFLFPIPLSLDYHPRSLKDLEMPAKETAPREMNSFIIFRRHLAYIVKLLQLSDDGKVLSSVASLIWRGASKTEKQEYAGIAEELKKRHLERYPNYTYERRRRKTAEEDFVYVSNDSFKLNKKKKKEDPIFRAESKPVCEESKPVHEECPPSSTFIQEQQGGYEWLISSFAPLTSLTSLSSDNSWPGCESTLQTQQGYDNECYTYPEAPRDHYYQIGNDANIPMVTNTLLSMNFTQVNPQVYLQQQQLMQQQTQPSTCYDLCSDYLLGGGCSGITQQFDDFLALEKPFDSFIL